MQDIVSPDMSPQFIVTRSRIHLLICLGKNVGCYYFASKQYNRSLYPILKLETVIYLRYADSNIYMRSRTQNMTFKIPGKLFASFCTRLVCPFYIK